ncbi:MAG: alpha/beta fold hydrolase [Desulfobacterales bacterium]|nr:alpha/beta fold hydrolase [Desulfobacterales bacterium]
MIYYRVIDIYEQQAPWLTMVHGFTQNHRYFSAQVAEFQKNFRLFLIDLRGHGRSARLAGPYGIEEYADDLLDAFDEAGVRTTHYWGTHTGSAVGLAFALRHPERLLSLVLEGTFLAGFSMPRAMELLDRVRSIARTKGVDAALEDWFRRADWFDYIRNHPDRCRADAHRRMIFEFSGAPLINELPPRELSNVAGSLPAIHPPALIYNGVDDMPDFKKAASCLESHLPNVRRVKIPNSGAFPAWEAPESVNHIVGHFLQEML